jgi:hypothetical protein
MTPIEALKSIHDGYDAFYIANKYGDHGTHDEEFKVLSEAVKNDELSGHAIAWIKDCWDCFDGDSSDYGDVENPFGYLLNYLNEHGYGGNL